MQNKKTRKNICKWLVMVFLFFSLPLIVYATETSVTATPFSMDFYGFIPSAQPGDLITVEDADGVVCGVFIVKTTGRYGFVHVYGDDLSTAVDEGARPGEQLTFLLNNIPLKGEEVVWAADGQRRQVDFAD